MRLKRYILNVKVLFLQLQGYGLCLATGATFPHVYCDAVARGRSIITQHHSKTIVDLRRWKIHDPHSGVARDLAFIIELVLQLCPRVVSSSPSRSCTMVTTRNQPIVKEALWLKAAWVWTSWRHSASFVGGGCSLGLANFLKEFAFSGCAIQAGCLVA
jgi:hypothetical protein